MSAVMASHRFSPVYMRHHGGWVPPPLAHVDMPKDRCHSPSCDLSHDDEFVVGPPDSMDLVTREHEEDRQHEEGE